MASTSGSSAFSPGTLPQAPCGPCRLGPWCREFAVVGALIQLGNCLDLLDTDHTRRLTQVAGVLRDNFHLPENRDKRRDLDCFLVNSYCEKMEEEGAFDTVRGLFQEGAPIVHGSEILQESHIQVVVRRPEAIIGLFRPSIEASVEAAQVAPSRQMVMIDPMGERDMQRVIVDPSVRKAEASFQRMLARLKNASREELIAWGIERGLLNEDGSPKLPEEPPYSAMP